MAHALFGYDGPCKNIHGHTYHLSVTLIGSPTQDTDDVKLGMVIDFSDLKKIIKDAISVNVITGEILSKKQVF